MAQDGHRQPVEMNAAPPRTDGHVGRAGGDIGVSPLSADGGGSVRAGGQEPEELGGYVSDAAAPAAAPSAAPPAAVAAPAAAAEWREARIETVEAASCLTAEISASAVLHNLALLRSLVGPDVRICPAVKADCYGHGLDVLTAVIASESDGLAVATAGEAFRLRELCYLGEVLMLFPTGPRAPGDLLGRLLTAEIRLTVISHEEVTLVERAARRTGLTGGVHVKVDTGMGRGGLAPSEAPGLTARIRSADHLQLRGLYTHLACADEADKASANRQMACFMRVAAACGREGLTLHAANSAAVIDMPSTHLGMVRPGIAVYGYQSSEDMLNFAALRPSLRLTGRIMQVKDVAPGSRCGYGLTYTFDRPSRIALVPVGYADGYLRSFSNRAVMRVAGRDVAVRGRVSMDQTIIDLTGVPAAKPGDEVEIISPIRSDPHSVESLARLAGTIPYEITCRLGNRVERTLVD